MCGIHRGTPVFSHNPKIRSWITFWIRSTGYSILPIKTWLVVSLCVSSAMYWHSVLAPEVSWDWTPTYLRPTMDKLYGKWLTDTNRGILVRIEGGVCPASWMHTTTVTVSLRSSGWISFSQFISLQILSDTFIIRQSTKARNKIYTHFGKQLCNGRLGPSAKPESTHHTDWSSLNSREANLICIMLI